MPDAAGNNQPLTVQQVADQKVAEVQARRVANRASRAAALAAHPAPLTVRTEIAGFAAHVVGGAGAILPAGAPAPVATTAQTAGYLLAVGDSWFDYPVHDILKRLEDNFAYNVESTAQAGAPIEKMISAEYGQLDGLSRNVEKITSLGVKPKAVLLSGGGDDIAGKEFGMLLNSSELQPIPGWNDQVLAGVIDTRIAAAFRLMLTSINTLCQQSFGQVYPILVHGYDYPVPDGRGFLGGGLLPGPWLKPGFDEKIFPDILDTTQKMVTIIDRFNVMLQGLVQEAGFGNVMYIDLRGTLSNAQANYKEWWANELHPNAGGLFGGQDGWQAIAVKFNAVLARLP